MVSKVEVMNKLYDAALVTGALFGAAHVSKVIFKDQPGVPLTMKGALKLTGSIVRDSKAAAKKEAFT